MTRPTVSIVIPAWNQWSYTRRCLETLRPTLGLRDRVVVVDNGSTDETAAGLARFNWVEVLTNPENRGFAAACNQGAAAAGDTEVVVFLNNDTLLAPRWLDELVAPFTDAAVGATGPRSNGVSGPQLVQEATYDPTDRAALRSFARSWQRAHSGSTTLFHRLVGFALAVRRQAFDAVGGFDDGFGIGGCEDDDLCRRLLDAGWRLLIAHGSYVHHFGHATFDANGVDWFGLQQANAGRYRAKHGAAIGQAPVSLSACMIVKDEEQLLAGCLDSLAGAVDEIVIYDTGSTDGTVALARARGATVIEGYWDDDFSRARNAALGHCRGEWILQIDADEILEGDAAGLRGLLGSAAEEIDVVAVEIVNLRGDGSAPADSQRAVRLFRRQRVHWRERLHEQLDLRPGQRPPLGAGFVAEVRLVHAGYLDEVVRRRDKWNRNLRVARAAFDASAVPGAPADGGLDTASGAAAPGRDRGEAELSLARALVDVGRAEEAVGHLYGALGTLTSPLGRRFALTYGIYVLLNLGRTSEALSWIGQLRELSSRSDLVDFLEGVAHHQSGRPATALRCYERVGALVDEDGFRPPAGTLARYRANVLVELGRHAEAADAFVEVLDAAFDTEVFLAAARAFVACGRPLAGLVALVDGEQLVGVAAALVGVDASVADQVADALWDRFGVVPALLASSALFGPALPSVRALRWSARLREANSAQHCPLVARARDLRVPPLERARSAALAGAGFNDERSPALLAAALPLVGDDDVATFVGDLAQLAPHLVAGAVPVAVTSNRRRRLILDASEQRGLVDLTAAVRAVPEPVA